VELWCGRPSHLSDVVRDAGQQEAQCEALMATSRIVVRTVMVLRPAYFMGISLKGVDPNAPNLIVCSVKLRDSRM